MEEVTLRAASPVLSLRSCSLDSVSPSSDANRSLSPALSRETRSFDRTL